MLDFWDFDDTTEWLPPLDAYCARSLCRIVLSEQPSCCVLEVGVWKGAWLKQAALGLAGVKAVGVDPYPNAEEIRERTVAALAECGLSEAVTLVPSWHEATDAIRNSSCGGWDVVHIDGLHSEIAVLQDLEESYAHLNEHAVVVLDDYRNFRFPGVASAMYQFMARSDLRLVMTTANKAYLVKQAAHATWLRRISARLDEEQLIYSMTGTRHSRYHHDPEVMGYPLILLEGPTNTRTLMAGLNGAKGAKGEKGGVNQKVRAIVAPRLPAGAKDWYRKTTGR